MNIPGAQLDSLSSISQLDGMTPGMTPGTIPGTIPGTTPGATSFDAILSQASSAGTSHGEYPNQKLHHASEQLVSNALIQPLLKQLRNSPFKVKMFHGGQAENAFGQKLDMILSDRIVHSSHFPIVDAVYRSLSRHSVSAAPKGGFNTHG